MQTEMELAMIDGRTWGTVADVAALIGRPEITLFKARKAGRLDSRERFGRIVVDLEQARALWPQAEAKGEATDDL